MAMGNPGESLISVALKVRRWELGALIRGTRRRKVSSYRQEHRSSLSAAQGQKPKSVFTENNKPKEKSQALRTHQNQEGRGKK